MLSMLYVGFWKRTSIALSSSFKINKYYWSLIKMILYNFNTWVKYIIFIIYQGRHKRNAMSALAGPYANMRSRRSKILSINYYILFYLVEYLRSFSLPNQNLIYFTFLKIYEYYIKDFIVLLDFFVCNFFSKWHYFYLLCHNWNNFWSSEW